MTPAIGDQFSEQVQPSGGRAPLSNFPSVAVVTVAGLTQAAELTDPTVFVVDYAGGLIFFDPSFDGLPMVVTYTVGKNIPAAPAVDAAVISLQQQLNTLTGKSMVRALALEVFTATGSLQVVTFTPEMAPKAIASAYLVDVLSGAVQATVFQAIDESDSGGTFAAGACWITPGQISASIPAGLAVASYRLSVLYFY